MDSTIQVHFFAHDSLTLPSVSLHKPERNLQTFGYTSTFVGIVDSRHDDGHILSYLPSNQSVPPPTYADSLRDVLPEYKAQDEPPTLAKHLFRFGFIFPLFWLLGAVLLITPLRAPTTHSPSSSPHVNNDNEPTTESWYPNKPKTEQDSFILYMRKAELKWAFRCLTAFGTLVLIILIGLIVGFAA